MPVQISNIEALSRLRLIEPTPNFWSSDELTQICVAGIRDLWRDIVDLKGEHYLVTNPSVYYDQNSDRLSQVPPDVHKIFMVEPVDLSGNSLNVGLQFSPRKFNDRLFQLARSRDPIAPQNDEIFYAITGQGHPVAAPIIRCAPMVTSRVYLNFSYVPGLPPLDTNSQVPIPGEADNALVAWTVAFARAKERDDRSPDPAWLSVYATEKGHLLQSLGLREYQDPQYVEAEFEEFW